MRSQFVFSEIWIGLRRNLTMTMALIVVVALSLSLLGTSLLFVKQVDKTRSVWQAQVEMAVYFCVPSSANTTCAKDGAATADEKAQLEQRLKSMPQVVSVQYISQAQAYQDFRTYYSNLPSLVHLTKEGDIPDSLGVRLRDAQADYGVVSSAASGAPGVDSVQNEAVVLGNFYRLLDAARNAVAILALIALVAAIMLVANTIRLSAFNRRRETAIMRLVGASNFYIQLPFLLEGTIAGLVGWAIAAVLIVGAKSVLLTTLTQYVSFNAGMGAGDLLEVLGLALLAGLVICASTSFITLRRYVRV
ncbi:MAG TPA: permease-like cell division protein FtsX [Streptosporangiaceae bacterium]|nr:permease-like cell division protein FtsX [Streptosporangiaceae bacterium]